MDKFKRKLRGFTLLELIVAIAILAVLSAIVVPNINSIVRTNKMLAANEQAQNIYMAAQDYLISLQIQGVKPEHIAADPSEVCVMRARTEIGNSSTTASYADHNISMVYQTTNFNMMNVHEYSFNGDTSNRKFGMPDGIESRLDPGFEGSWVVVFYPRTFTVAYVVYSNQYSTADECNEAVKLIGTNGGHGGGSCDDRLYQYVFEGFSTDTKMSQESDMRHPQSGEAPHMYTGQYPIPGPTIT